ncbi:hypothetical protein BBK36DRAFT_1186743 [Trichoderma citrinoviride]|uniref:Uncharacterized protein n=1 Tax=Trichoderma citrinoviride TaxID=58853 RepID=A0A2T4BJ28_9HYPO|nr:hypothetical protein BBK36DRAFT_1186743 [Trichoderma citrinoviride]PTB69315.1 hypothetical protein BBK36DRAFT_1186743 [Trichoderma citrinoviride]
MDGPPPNYDDISSAAPKLLVRLEVWYFSSHGRSQEKNELLAVAFEEAEPDNWSVRTVDVVEPHDEADRDDFVDFEHREITNYDPNGRAQNHVRDLFRRIAPGVILNFFLSISRKPHTMSLVARNVLPDYRARYCQLFVINKLNTRVDELSAPPEVTDLEDIVTQLSTVDNGLPMLSQVVEVFTVFRLFQTQTKPKFSFMHPQDVESVFNLRTTGLENVEPLATIAENLRFLYEANLNQTAAELSAAPVEWASAVAPFRAFQSELSGVLVNLAKTDLGSQRKPKRGISVTPQVLYMAGLNLRTGGIMLSRAGDLLRPYLDEQLLQYDGRTLSPRNLAIGGSASGVGGVGTGGAILYGTLASSPLGWTIAALLCVGAVAAAVAYRGVSKEVEAIKKFKQYLKDMAGAFDEAQKAIVAVICQDVMGMELGSFRPDEQDAILKSFGIDVSALGQGEYQRSLLESSIDKLVQYYEEMREQFEHMVEVCGLDVRNVKLAL